MLQCCSALAVGGEGLNGRVGVPHHHRDEERNQTMAEKMGKRREAPAREPIKAMSLDEMLRADAVAAALVPLDRVAADIERKWGPGRVEALVSPETAARFASARRRLDEAIAAGVVEDVAKRAAVLMRGWRALDAEAAALGATPLPAGAVGATVDGTRYVVTMHDRDAAAPGLARDGETVVSLPELLRVWRHRWARAAVAADAVKAVFPGAVVTRVAKGEAEAENGLDDEIPF